MRRFVILLGAVLIATAVGLDLLGIGQPGFGFKQILLLLVGAGIVFAGIGWDRVPWCRLMGGTLAALGLLFALGFGYEAFLSLSPPKANENPQSEFFRAIVLREWPPERGFLVKPGLKKYDNIERKDYRMDIDEDGFIRPSRVHQDPDVEVVFLGGSTTECMFVDPDKRFPSLVGRLLSDAYGKVNSYNGGKAGNNTLHSLNSLLNKIIPMQPDAVVMMHNVNDLSALMFGETNWTKVISGRSPILHISNRVTLRDVLETLFPRIAVKFQTVGDEFVALRGEKREIDYEFCAAEFRKNIRTFVSLCRARGLNAVLMTQPSRLKEDPDPYIREVVSRIEADFVIDYAGYRALHESFNEIIREVGRENAVPVIDLALRVPREREYFADMYHYNDAGSELIAAIVAEELARLNLGSN